MLAFARSGTKLAALRQSAEEGLLHGVLCQRLVAEDAEREPVGDAADPVVQLGQGRLVAARDERHQGFVGQVSQVPACAHDHVPLGGDGRRYHRHRDRHSSLIRARGCAGSALPEGRTASAPQSNQAPTPTTKETWDEQADHPRGRALRSRARHSPPR